MSDLNRIVKIELPVGTSITVLPQPRGPLGPTSNFVGRLKDDKNKDTNQYQLLLGEGWRVEEAL